jgi:hypothetical protein
MDIGSSLTGVLVAGGNTCSVATPGGALFIGEPPSVAEEDKAWLPGWCIYYSAVTYQITAFPPDCVAAETSKLAVLVKRTSTGDAPNIDNSLVGMEEWYIVIYDIDGSPLNGVFYEYAQCCKNETPENPATSHLIRVEFFNVVVGTGTYDLTWLNVITLGIYGDCE